MTVTPLAGVRYGTRTFTGGIRMQGIHRQFKMRCDCGLERWVRATTLVGKAHPSPCRSCVQREYEGYGDVGAWFMRSLAATKRHGKWDVTVTPAYLQSLWNRQDGKCAYTGIPLVFAKTKEDAPGTQTASLDRVCSEMGYIPGNVQWVHKDVNIMKNKFSHDYFIQMCKLIAYEV